MRGIRQKWLNMGLGTKLISVGISSLVVVLTVMLVSYLVYVSSASRERALSDATSNNNILVDQLNHVFVNTEQMTELIVTSDTMQKCFNTDDRIDQLESKYTLSCLINNLPKNSVSTDSVILYHRTGWVIVSSYINLSMVDMELFDAEHSNGEASEQYWVPMHQRDYYVFNGKKAAISFRRRIDSIYSGETIGVIAVDVPEDKIFSCYSEQLNDRTDIVILDSDGRVVSARDKSLLFKASESLWTFTDDGRCRLPGGDECYVTTASVEKLGWTIIRLDRRDSVFGTVFSEVWLTVLISLATLAGTSVAVVSIVRSILRPINTLILIINSPNDSFYFNDRLIAPGHDEIGTLVESFSAMQRRLQILIERIKYEQSQKAKLEILTLQANIKPHFLYNTIESVCALIQMERSDDAIKMLKSIENFYRGTLSSGRYLITLREELGITSRYFEIQKLKYFGTLNVEINISEEVMDCMIPKLTLQPLVENSIYHGLKNGGSDGLILITEKHNDCSVTICIEDNGVGFDATKGLTIKGNKASESYAISNIINRLKLCFGSECGLDIESEIGHGTKVYIHIPRTTVNDKEDN